MNAPRFEPVLRTQSDVAQAWQHLMGPGGFGGHSVWMMLIVDERPLPRLTEITDSEEPPDGDLVTNFAELLAQLAHHHDGALSFAFLISRPGAAVVTGRDRSWARALYAAPRIAGVACEVVHLATADLITPIPPDDVGFDRVDLLPA
jgi:hypothetical protein